MALRFKCPGVQATTVVGKLSPQCVVAPTWPAHWRKGHIFFHFRQALPYMSNSMTRHFFVVLLIVATSCGSTHIERGESFGRHPSFATTTAPPTSALPAPATTTTSSSSSVPILVGPAPLSPSEQVEEVSLPSNVDGSATGLGGQIRDRFRPTRRLWVGVELLHGPLGFVSQCPTQRR